MNVVGIDLHKVFLVVAVEDENGPVGKPKRLWCRDEDAIVEHFRALQPFRAVIEASCSYRWLYELLSPLGSVVLAHPYRLRAIVAARAKTDKLDAALLAQLLRADLIPQAYIPPEPFQQLRDVARDELLRRLDHFVREIQTMDAELERQADAFPEIEALTVLHGIGEYSALLIVAEIGEPGRFGSAKQVGAYAGLTARVNQSGSHCYHGHITKQGSRWLRWILVQAAMKIVRKDQKLNNFYTRIRKRSGRNVARVAVARKLAGICWLRLRRWHREHTSTST